MFSQVQDFIQGISKLAARPAADRKAIGRVYAQAKAAELSADLSERGPTLRP